MSRLRILLPLLIAAPAVSHAEIRFIKAGETTWLWLSGQGSKAQTQSDLAARVPSANDPWLKELHRLGAKKGTEWEWLTKQLSSPPRGIVATPIRAKLEVSSADVHLVSGAASLDLKNDGWPKDSVNAKAAETFLDENLKLGQGAAHKAEAKFSGGWTAILAQRGPLLIEGGGKALLVQIADAPVASTSGSTPTPPSTAPASVPETKSGEAKKDGDGLTVLLAGLGGVLIGAIAAMLFALSRTKKPAPSSGPTFEQSVANLRKSAPDDLRNLPGGPEEWMREVFKTYRTTRKKADGYDEAVGRLQGVEQREKAVGQVEQQLSQREARVGEIEQRYQTVAASLQATKAALDEKTRIADTLSKDRAARDAEVIRRNERATDLAELVQIGDAAAADAQRELSDRMDLAAIIASLIRHSLAHLALAAESCDPNLERAMVENLIRIGDLRIFNTFTQLAERATAYADKWLKDVPSLPKSAQLHRLHRDFQAQLNFLKDQRGMRISPYALGVDAQGAPMHVVLGL